MLEDQREGAALVGVVINNEDFALHGDKTVRRLRFALVLRENLSYPEQMDNPET
jgi:hypothetical protein